MPGRQVRDAHGRRRLVDVLAAGAGRAIGIDAEIVVVDGDLVVIFDLGQHLDQRERGVAPVGGIERREAHQPVRPRLRLGVAVGARPANLDRRVLDPGFLAVGGIEDLRFQPAPLRPAHVHAGEHLRPVLGVDPAFAGVDDEDGVGAVVRPGEGRVQLELVDLLLELGAFPHELGGELLVVRRQLFEHGELLGLGRQPPPLADFVAHLTQAAHLRLGGAGVVPEPRFGALRVERGDLLLYGSQVKDAPRAGRDAGGCCRGRWLFRWWTSCMQSAPKSMK